MFSTRAIGKVRSMTPQCVDKMLSSNTFLETRIQLLYDGVFKFEKVLGMHVQRMLEMSRCLYKQNVSEKSLENL